MTGRTPAAPSPKVILLCGRLCVGKTTYARGLLNAPLTVCLSADDLMTALFPEPLGDAYDEALARAQAYLQERASDLVRAGADVILDGGAWRRADRERVSAYCADRGIPFEWHFVDATDAAWRRNIQKRNDDVRRGAQGVYYVDEGLLNKCRALFEKPREDEVDVYILDGCVRDMRES